MRPLDVFLSQIFLSLETFLQKATTLNIFEALIFNYKIKINSVEQCSPQIVGFVVDLCNELQLSLRDCVVDTNDKPDIVVRSETSYCELQPENPVASTSEFVTYASSTNDVSESNTEGCFIVKEIEEAVVDETSAVSAVQEKQKTVYTCEFCNRKYRTSEKLARHICKSAPVNDLREDELIDDPESPDVSQKVRTSEKLARHVCKSVPVNDLREDELIDDPGSPDVSQSSHKSESATDLFVCAVCFASFSQRELFGQHSHTDTSQEVELVTDLSRLQSQRKFTCGVCSEVYRSLARISYHVAHCCQGPYHCELCPYLAHTKQLLNRHKKKHHKGVESFFCTECGLGFKLRTSLQKHLVNRHESVQDHFPCETDGCGQVFTKKVQLTNHRIEVHGVQRKFLCQVCGHKFMTQDSLSSHLECHSNKRRFECQFCSKLFNTKEKLTFHVRTHTGEKPYVCDRGTCRKSFVSKSKLMEHIQRHNGEKRHKCTVCGKQYANKPDLRTHLRKLHTEHAQNTTDVYSPQLVMPSLQFFPVSVPQNMVITSYETVVTI